MEYKKSEQTKIKTIEPLFYDNADMKRLYHISDKTLQRMRNDKRILFIKIGKKIFYPIEHFKKLAQEQLNAF